MDHTITLGSIIGIVTIIVGVTAILMNSRKIRRDNEADGRLRTDELKGEIRLHNDSVEKRLVTLESRSADFMPRGEIESKLDHEKANRALADQGLKAAVDRHAEAIVEIRVDQGKMSERHASLASTMEEIKTLVKEQGKDLGARLDKLTDTMAGQRSAGQ